MELVGVGAASLWRGRRHLPAALTLADGSTLLMTANLGAAAARADVPPHGWRELYSGGTATVDSLGPWSVLWHLREAS